MKIEMLAGCLCWTREINMPFGGLKKTEKFFFSLECLSNCFKIWYGDNYHWTVHFDVSVIDLDLIQGYMCMLEPKTSRVIF